MRWNVSNLKFPGPVRGANGEIISSLKYKQILTIMTVDLEERNIKTWLIQVDESTLEKYKYFKLFFLTKFTTLWTGKTILFRIMQILDAG